MDPGRLRITLRLCARLTRPATISFTSGERARLTIDREITPLEIGRLYFLFFTASDTPASLEPYARIS